MRFGFRLPGFLGHIPQPSPAPHLMIPHDPTRPSGTREQPAPAAQPVPQKESIVIKISFNNIQHALAAFFKQAAADGKTVALDVAAGIEKIEADKPEIEAVSAAVATAVEPGSQTVVLKVEDAAFAVLGSIDAAIKAGGAAVVQKLLDAGLDQTAIDAAKAVGSASETFYRIANTAASATAANATA